MIIRDDFHANAQAKLALEKNVDDAVRRDILLAGHEASEAAAYAFGVSAKLAVGDPDFAPAMKEFLRAKTSLDRAMVAIRNCK